MASAPPQDGSPGDNLAPDAASSSPLPAVAMQTGQALQAGYSWNEIEQHVADTQQDDTVDAMNQVSAAARPSLSDIWGGTMNQPGRDKVNEGAGPVGETLIGAIAGGGVGAAKNLLVGAAEEAIGAVSSRAVQMGVQTSVGREVPAAAAKFQETQAIKRWVYPAVKWASAAFASSVVLDDKGLK